MSLDKKAQIGTTLTWIAGTVIIFFVMLIFVLGVTSLAGIKEVQKGVSSIFSLGSSSNEYKSGLEEMEFENKVYFMLNKEINIIDNEKGETVKGRLVDNLFEDFKSDLIKKEMERIIESELGQKCYSFWFKTDNVLVAYNFQAEIIYPEEKILYLPYKGQIKTIRFKEAETCQIG
jgi:hypothetical protein